jgi:vacuolar protein sorting-associated protein 54
VNVIDTADEPSRGLRGLDRSIMSSPAPRKSVDSTASPVFSPASPSPSKEYPFPRYESSQRPNSSGRYQPRRGSTTGSISSVGGALDISSSSCPEAVRESGQNGKLFRRPAQLEALANWILTAISTLLQPPIVRTGLLPHTFAPASSTHRQPTAHDIPPVTLTNITHVDPAEFKPYLSQVGALYDALQRAKENEDEGTLRLLRKGSQVDSFEDLLDKSLRQSGRTPTRSRKASIASLASLSAADPPPPRRRSSGGIGRRAAQAPTPLSTLPGVYFEDDFHLENPRTFDVVSERSEVVRPVPGTPDKNASGNTVAPRKALATNAILQEKLSWYMDTIEVHLISSISTASTSFFAALGSLRELHSEAADLVERIKSLRAELDALDKKTAIGGLDIVNERRRRENLKQLADATNQLRHIVEGVSRCESLVDDGQIEKALDAVDSLEKLIRGEQSQSDADILGTERQLRLRDLRGATTLQGVTSDLDTLRYRVGKAFETKFLGALLGDLRRHIDQAPIRDTLLRWSSASQRSRVGHNREPSVFPLYLALDEKFRSELLAYLKGLHRAHHTSPAAAAYRDSVLREVKSIIKRPLPSSNDDDNESIMSASTMGNRQLSQQERSAILARNLRALEPSSAEETLVKIYIGVGETLRRLGTQVKVLLDVTSTIDDPAAGAGPKSPPRSPSPNVAAIDGRLSGVDGNYQSSARQLQEEMHQALDMSNLLGQAVDIAQNQIVKILRVRTEQSVHQTPTRFLRYFTINLLFANECEAVSGRGGTALKNLVNSQIRDFIKQMGEAEQQKLAHGMDSDQWDPKDFGEKDSVLLSRVLEGSTRDAEAWTVGGKIWLQYDESTFDDPVANGKGPLTNGTGTKDKARPATIDSESFILPTSAMLFLRGLQPFMELITGIPSLTAEISSSLLSYLQLFNSRCTQLILGAGATRSVGLKNINTRHLALASQALSFITNLIPHIREFVRRHAGSGAAVSSLMGEFDKVKRLYQEHQNNISEKLVDIMTNRASGHVKAMKAINWDTIKVTGVSPYMETLAKETTTLHKVLSKFLPDSTVLMIMEPVFKSYKEQFGQAFRDVTVETEEGKKRLVYLLNDAYSIQLLTFVRLLVDVQSLNDRIGNVNGAGDIGEYLLKLINDKTVLRPPSPVPKPSETDLAVTNGADSAELPKGEHKGPENNPRPAEKEDARPPMVAESKKQSMEKS